MLCRAPSRAPPRAETGAAQKKTVHEPPNVAEVRLFRLHALRMAVSSGARQVFAPAGATGKVGLVISSIFKVAHFMVSNKKHDKSMKSFQLIIFFSLRFS
jgi:hypothetical protein